MCRRACAVWTDEDLVTHETVRPIIVLAQEPTCTEDVAAHGERDPTKRCASTFGSSGRTTKESKLHHAECIEQRTNRQAERACRLRRIIERPPTEHQEARITTVSDQIECRDPRASIGVVLQRLDKTVGTSDRFQEAN